MIRTHRPRNKVDRDNPGKRGQQFLDVRLAPVRPKGAGLGAAASPDGTRLTRGEPERRLPRDLRVKLVEQYRRHQRTEADHRVAARPGEAADEDPSRGRGSPPALHRSMGGSL